jgi:hypothetical protein
MTRTIMFAATLTTCVATSALAQQPRVTNGRVVPQAVGASLEATVRQLVAAQAEPGWIGYAVPVVSGDRVMCCGRGDGTWISDGVSFTNGRWNGCGLEEGRASGAQATASAQAGSTQAGPVHLEGPDQVMVLYRVEEKAVQKIRIFSPDCELDAGGRTIHWLDAVKGADSVALLAGYVAHDEQKRDRLSDSAITAIALHKDDAADAALERLASASQPEFVRKKVTFWLGTTRGRRGFDVVLRMAKNDPSDEVRKSAMFALSQSREPEALASLIQFARQDPSPKVRADAIFWLSQKAGQRAATEITAAIDRDPDTDVKKKAVFALSQLPKDEGVPLLIQVAKDNKNPVVRKQAIFWLGQSQDPRALDFFAQVLGK